MEKSCLVGRTMHRDFFPLKLVGPANSTKTPSNSPLAEEEEELSFDKIDAYNKAKRVTAAIRTSTSDSVGEDKNVWAIVKDKERLRERTFYEQPYFQLSFRMRSSAPTKMILTPLWPGLELVMASTSAEVPIPPDHEARDNVVVLVRETGKLGKEVHVSGKNLHAIKIGSNCKSMFRWDSQFGFLATFTCTSPLEQGLASLTELILFVALPSFVSMPPSKCAMSFWCDVPVNKRYIAPQIIAFNIFTIYRKTEYFVRLYHELTYDDGKSGLEPLLSSFLNNRDFIVSGLEPLLSPFLNNRDFIVVCPLIWGVYELYPKLTYDYGHRILEPLLASFL
ncbi:hypothetical protein YC2023_048108 [Brassica napus]